MRRFIFQIRIEYDSEIGGAGRGTRCHGPRMGALAQLGSRSTPTSPSRLYNTAKQKLLEGKQIFGVTVSSPDPNILLRRRQLRLRLYLD